LSPALRLGPVSDRARLPQPRSGRRTGLFDRGRDKGLNLAPPSEPDRRVSRIRLSSQWVLCREGAALRLVPKSVGQTFGITQANCTRLIPPPASPRGHSRWFAFPSFCPSHFHLPASLGSTVVTRFSATTDALTPSGRFFGRCRHERRLTPAGLPDYGPRDFRPFRLQPSACCPRIARMPAGIARRDRLRLSLADSPTHADRIEFTAMTHAEPSMLRTGRSRSVALHPALLRRSYGSIPHDSSPHRSGLLPLCPLSLSGALAPVFQPACSQ
jgi:hypothetical protein